MIELLLKIDHGIEISRVKRSKKAAKRAYNRLSGVYDLLEGRWENEARTAGLRRLCLIEGEDVLEIGPGTGQALQALARSTGALGKVYAIDISPKMLQRTRKRLDDAGFHDRARLILGDGARLPLKPSSFDAHFHELHFGVVRHSGDRTSFVRVQKGLKKSGTDMCAIPF